MTRSAAINFSPVWDVVYWPVLVLAVGILLVHLMDPVRPAWTHKVHQVHQQDAHRQHEHRPVDHSTGEKLIAAGQRHPASATCSETARSSPTANGRPHRTPPRQAGFQQALRLAHLVARQVFGIPRLPQLVSNLDVGQHNRIVTTPNAQRPRLNCTIEAAHHHTQLGFFRAKRADRTDGERNGQGHADSR